MCLDLIDLISLRVWRWCLCGTLFAVCYILYYIYHLLAEVELRRCGNLETIPLYHGSDLLSLYTLAHG